VNHDPAPSPQGRCQCSAAESVDPAAPRPAPASAPESVHLAPALAADDIPPATDSLAPGLLSESGSLSPPASLTRQALAVKGLVSLWIVYHLAGIVVAPASVPPSSELVRNVWRGFGWYLQTLHLNHGFHFFAPDPGPSTIVRYAAELPDGGVTTGQIPDRETMRPRLLYHRHFMLTESLAATDMLPLEVAPLHVRAMARQIARQHGATHVSLSRVTHLLPDMAWCRAGLPLDDPQLYEEQPLGRFAWSDF